MTRAATILFLLLLTAVPAVHAGTLVRMVTDAGEVLIHLEDAAAPVTVTNFLAHVDAHGYADGRLYRVVTPDNQPDSPVRIEVVQGGLGFDAAEVRPPIPHEPTDETGLSHVDGTISMARSAPGTASSEFFVCIGDQPELDAGGRRNPDGEGFAAFGRVVAGMEVLRAVQRAPTRPAVEGGDPFEGQFLAEPVLIRAVTRVPGAR